MSSYWVKYPESRKAQCLNNHKKGPGDSGSQLTDPEEGAVYGIGIELLVIALVPPHFSALLVEVTPPPQSHQQSSSDVLNHPEIDRSQQNHHDEQLYVVE